MSDASTKNLAGLYYNYASLNQQRINSRIIMRIKITFEIGTADNMGFACNTRICELLFTLIEYNISCVIFDQIFILNLIPMSAQNIITSCE